MQAGRNDAGNESIALDADGYVSVPQKTGVGLDIDWDGVVRVATAVLG